MSAVQTSTGWRLGQPAAERVIPFPPPPAREPVAPAERYRPRTLDQVVGQDAAVGRLRAFLKAPHPTGWVFIGETGTGKTSTALALAAGLGAVEFGGLDRLDSGSLDGENIQRAVRNLRYAP